MLKSHFGDRVEFIHGNNLDVLPNLEKRYDLFHIDGKHNIDHISKEINLCQKLRSSSIYKLVLDDVNCRLPLANEILEKCKVIKSITPKCPWRNTFMEIPLVPPKSAKS